MSAFLLGAACSPFSPQAHSLTRSLRPDFNLLTLQDVSNISNRTDKKVSSFVKSYFSNNPARSDVAETLRKRKATKSVTKVKGQARSASKPKHKQKQRRM